MKHEETYESYTKTQIPVEKRLTQIDTQNSKKLKKWILDIWVRKVFVSESLIKEIAIRLLALANQNLEEEAKISLCLSYGWLDRLKKTNGFEPFMSHGEDSDADNVLLGKSYVVASKISHTHWMFCLVCFTKLFLLEI